MTGTPESLALVAGGKAAARRFVFADAILDERTLELLVRGQPAELEPKPLEVLRHLLTHAGEVVTKDELLAAVWPGRILSDTVLTKCIARLREVLGDEDQSVIKTVHGYGYRLLAPVKVEVSAPASAAPQFNFKPGDHPPQRPLWSLVERLGQGSHGEAWLVRHDKTREQRVYKFAPDTAALHALKREITLYRLLHDALGDAAPCIAALDWNLEESPYFLELEYAPGGSLVDWVQARNGLGQVPLAQRLEIAAQAAECLASAHAMGVLHKDLKPSNILVVSPPDAPLQVKLGDFGSGGVLDEGRLAAMGITRMGFTQTIQAGLAGGTPLYLAPEVIAGQPATVQADIYALGVVLYQLLVGDLWRPLASGWEQDIEDELLREDIAFAVEGHVERRLGTAAQLAQRLRTLEQRRAERTAQREAQSEATRQRIEMQRVLARRGWVRATIGVLVAGLAATGVLYAKAQRAVETADAVGDFLNQDVLSSADPWKQPTRSVTIKDALDRAAGEIDARFGERPEVAARLHATVGEVYLRMQESPTAKVHLEKAVAIHGELQGRRSASRIAALEALAGANNELGLEAACPMFKEVLDYRQARAGAADLELLRARFNVATCGFGSDFVGVAASLQDILEDSQRAGITDSDFLLKLKEFLALALSQTGAIAQAEALHREVLQGLAAQYGESHLRTALQRKNLALLLDKTGGYEEAAQQLEQGLRDLAGWASATEAHSIEFLALLGHVQTRQGRLDQALANLTEANRLAREKFGKETHWLTQIPTLRAAVLVRQNRFDEAIAELKSALALSEKLFGAEARFTLDNGIRLAGALRAKGQLDAAWAALNRVSREGLAKLPPRHYLSAGYRREEGLLHLAERRPGPARDALAEALSTYEHSIGSGHPLTTEVRQELERAAAAAGSG